MLSTILPSVAKYLGFNITSVPSALNNTDLQLGEMSASADLLLKKVCETSKYVSCGLDEPPVPELSQIKML
jgi:hypothetical protein